MPFQKGNTINNGRVRSKETRDKISLSKKGCISHRKGKTMVQEYGKKKAQEYIKKMSEAHKGYKMPEIQKRKISNSVKREKYLSYWKGKKMSKESNLKRSKTLKGKYIGELSNSWKGGKSFEEYGIMFNKKLKEIVRSRDEYKCQECGYTEKQLGYNLSVHHIDYNKKNNVVSNLISLCKSCHSKTNFNRIEWGKYYKNIIQKQYTIMSRL